MVRLGHSAATPQAAAPSPARDRRDFRGGWHYRREGGGCGGGLEIRFDPLTPALFPTAKHSPKIMSSVEEREQNPATTDV